MTLWKEFVSLRVWRTTEGVTRASHGEGGESSQVQ
jgi:hypothetical protein